jgi:uncharacterized membrane protein
MATTRQEVALAVAEAPEGWQSVLRGGGFVIGGVTADPAEPPAVDLEVAVPTDAANGQHTVVVEATGPGGSDRLELVLEVASQPVGGIALETEFPTLRGGPDDTFRYDLQLTNQTPDEITLAFDAVGPEGWVLTAGPASEQQASTVTVAPGESESVTVEATPPGDVAAGSYPIEVRAVGDGLTGSLTVNAEVTGQGSLTLVTPGQRLDIDGEAGDTTSTPLLVVNDGAAPLADVTFSADPPEGWEVEFDPETLEAVAPGETQQVTARIQPSSDAVAGDYAIAVSARSGGESGDVAYRFTVETSRWWGAIGIGIVVVALGVLFVVFRVYGRR